jgi:hypothetical protein
MKRTRIDQFLQDSVDNPPMETSAVLNGPDTVKNILINETNKLNRLESVTNELLNYITDSNAIKRLTYKEKKSLLETITTIQNNTRDFIFRVAEVSAKNTFLQELLKTTQGPRQLVQSSNGEVYESNIDDHTRKQLTELLRDMVNDEVRDK